MPVEKSMEAQQGQRENPDRPLRNITPTLKALESSIEKKTSLFWKTQKHLEAAVNNLLRVDPTSTDIPTLRDAVKSSYKTFNEEVSDLRQLYSHEKMNQADLQQLLLTAKKWFETADGALSSADRFQPPPQPVGALSSAEGHQRTPQRNLTENSDKRSRTGSGTTRLSSTSKRLEARARLAEQQTKFEFEEKIQQMELQQKLRSAEIEKQKLIDEAELNRIKAKRDLEMAQASANVYEFEDFPEHFEPPEEEIDHTTATRNWLENDVKPDVKPKFLPSFVDVPSPATVPPPKPNTISGFAGNSSLFTPAQQLVPNQQFAYSDITGHRLLQECINLQQDTTKKIVSSLAKQSLPKFEPDVFSGDAALFLPWRIAFKAMMQDVDASPEQEINLLLKYTSGNPRSTVNTFRRRIHPDNHTKLIDLWKTLEERYGHKAEITNALLKNLQDSARFKPDDREGFQRFFDVCEDVNSQIPYLNGLAILNSSFYMKTLVEKVPKIIKEKWESSITKYMVGAHADDYPPFSTFVQVVKTIAVKMNHPAIVKVPGADYEMSQTRSSKPNPYFPHRRTDNPRLTRTMKIDVGVKQESHHNPGSSSNKPEVDVACPLHPHAIRKHTLLNCRLFAEKHVDEREKIVKDNEICFRCLVKKHYSRRCQVNVKCDNCGGRHQTLFHRDTITDAETPSEPTSHQSGERPERVESACSKICGDGVKGKSCGKIVLGDVFDKNNPENTFRSYIILDDQSNHTLGTANLFDSLNISGEKQQYTMETCHGTKICNGRRGLNLAICSLDGKVYDLPTLIEANNLPEDKGEIPTPKVIKEIPHLKSISKFLPPLEETTSINLLIGRDAPELLKVRDFINGPRGAPWAQLMDLGWTVSGELCLDRQGGRVHVSSCRTLTGIQHDFQPCQYKIKCKENLKLVNQSALTNSVNCRRSLTHHQEVLSEIAKDEFHITDHDSEVGTSPEDRRFLKCMEDGFHKNSLGNWEAPLPFRNPEVKMPDNRSHVEKRFKNLQKNFARNSQLQKDYFEFMNKILQRGHASRVPDSQLVTEPGRKWLLPHFAVYHPQKPSQIRVVFDSSAEYGGTSLNQELLPGPDLMNKLIGRLLRFRQHEIGIMCDIEQMFYSFYVNREHRDFIRFLWFAEEDPESPVVEYRMNVHLFGNGPSPAIATFGLRKSAEDPSNKYEEETRKFIKEDFYVDDGVYSCQSSSKAINLLKSAQKMLAESNIRLHKVASNDPDVMKSFPHEDLAKRLTDLDFSKDKLPCQRTLGVQWDLEEDVFTFKFNQKDKPYTRRGVLSVINSLYDPFGFLAPFIITAKKILQTLIQLGRSKGDPLLWDDPLPTDLEAEWYKWYNDLQSLDEIRVQRSFKPPNFGNVTRIELHAFSDASKDALAAVLYLRIYNSNGTISVSFVRGAAKVKPQRHLSIPRMELCAAVLLVTIVKQTVVELEYDIDCTYHYTDSKVVLGYIMNESRRFHVYVANRVELIRSLSSPESWRYVESEVNPADIATRGCSATKIMKISWLSGPTFLASGEDIPFKTHSLIEEDHEVRNTKVLATSVTASTSCSLCDYFAYFSSFYRLCRNIANLKLFLRQKKQNLSNMEIDSQILSEAEVIILQHVQEEAFPQELKILHNKSADNSKRQLQGLCCHNLDPYIEDGLLRVGGRLRRANLSHSEIHPVILPKHSHVTQLIARHYHEKNFHQGRSITHGAIRQAGYWIISGSSVVNSLIRNCVKCKLLRRPTEVPKMADLPEDRLCQTPPFTNVGMDAFGPWEITVRKTRGTSINNKRWGIIFTCLYSRAIHIEVVDSMDTSAFINAMRRFFAIRGPVAILRSDCGTNFVGACNELREALKEVNSDQVKQFLLNHECQWIWNPPHASHFGGIWERQIGTLRRVLEGMLLELGRSQLTHDLLVTLMSEAAAIVNSRPLSAIPVDPENPMPLSPANILTAKTRPYVPSPGAFVEPDLYCRRRWRRTQYLADQFWLRWRKEYLQEQQKRRKWTQSTPSLSVNDIVLIHDKNVVRGFWPKGRIVEAIPDADGVVRQLEVEVYEDDDPTSRNLCGRRKRYRRPSSELVFLYREGSG